MKSVDHLQTMALTYQEICQGEQPWVALGNFMNDWFDYASDRRVELITAPLSIPEHPSEELLRWAVFCAASIEYLCERSDIPCPTGTHDPRYVLLAEPWFDAPMAHKPSVRAFLLEQTPEPFARRNIYCGNRMFANKYEFAEQYLRIPLELRNEMSTQYLKSPLKTPKKVSDSSVCPKKIKCSFTILILLFMSCTCSAILLEASKDGML